MFCDVESDGPSRPTYPRCIPAMIKKGSSRYSLSLLAAIKVHKHFSGSTGHTKAAFTRVDIMTSGKEIGVERWVVE